MIHRPARPLRRCAVHLWTFVFVPLAFSALSFSASAAEPSDAVEPSESSGDSASASENKSSAALAEVSEEQLATARLHFQNGVELMQATPPNYQDAYQQLLLALELSGRSWKVMGNLALTALKLERDGEALEYYKEYLERGGDEIDPREKASIEREVLLARGNLATINVESTDPEARISVSRQGSSAPTQLYDLEGGKATLGLRSGALTIVATSGKKRLEWAPALSAGEEASHVFDFDAEPVAPAAGTGTAPTTDPAVNDGSAYRRPRGLFIAGLATAGLGVLTVGGGAVLGVMSQNKESDARDSCIDDVCQEATESDFDSAASMATVANVLFISGGVLVATGVTLTLLGSKSKSEHSSNGKHSSNSKHSARSRYLEVAPQLSPAGAGIFAHGKF